MRCSRPVLRRCAVVLAMVVVAAACGGGSDDGAKADGGDRDRTSTTADGAGSGGGADGGPDGTTNGAGDGPDSISNAETVPQAQSGLRPNKHGAPLPGRYLYDVAGSDDPVELSVQDTLGDQKADSFDRTGNLIQLHIELDGAEARASLLHWRAEGVLLDAEQRARNTTSGTNRSATCDYEPNLLVQAGSLQVGARWTDESSCSATQDDVTVRRDRTVTGEVTGRSSVTVEGRTIETLRIRQVVDTTTTSDTTPPLLVVERREVTTDWIVAAGLAGRVQGTIVDTVSGAAQPPRTFTWTLRSTTPAA